MDFVWMKYQAHYESTFLMPLEKHFYLILFDISEFALNFPETITVE